MLGLQTMVRVMVPQLGLPKVVYTLATQAAEAKVDPMVGGHGKFSPWLAFVKAMNSMKEAVNGAVLPTWASTMLRTKS